MTLARPMSSSVSWLASATSRLMSKPRASRSGDSSSKSQRARRTCSAAVAYALTRRGLATIGLAWGCPCKEMPNSVSVPMIRRTLMQRAYGGWQRPCRRGFEPPVLPICACYRPEAFGRASTRFQGGTTLLRTRKTRHVGGALVLALTMIASLGVGAVGRSAQADDPATPSGTPTVSGDPSPQQTPSSSTPNGSTEQQGLTRQLVTALGGGPTVGPDAAFVLKRGLTGSVSVAGNDTCGPPGAPTACSYSAAALPAGWSGSIDP